MSIIRVVPTNDSGAGIDGTILNAAWLVTLYDSIENWATTAYTPTWTGSVTNPANYTATGKYLEIGDVVIFVFNISTSGATTYGSGSYSVSLPVTASASLIGNVQLVVRDASAGGAFYPGYGFVATTTTILLLTPASPSVNWTTTVPVTFANGDSLQGCGVYLRA